MGKCVAETCRRLAVALQALQANAADDTSKVFTQVQIRMQILLKEVGTGVAIRLCARSLC